MSSYSSFEEDKKRFDDWRHYLLKEERTILSERSIASRFWGLFQPKDTPGNEKADAEGAKPIIDKVHKFLQIVKESLAGGKNMELVVKDALDSLGLGEYLNKFASHLEAYTEQLGQINAGKLTYGGFLDFIQDITTYVLNQGPIEEIKSLMAELIVKNVNLKSILAKIPGIAAFVNSAETFLDISDKLITAYKLADGLATGKGDVSKLRALVLRPDGKDPHPLLKYVNLDDAYENAFETNQKLMNAFLLYFHELKDEMEAKANEEMPPDFVDVYFKNFLATKINLEASPIDKKGN